MAILNEDKEQGVVEKSETEQKADKARIDDEVGFWLNNTKSGKGVIIVIEDKAFISSKTNLQDFVDGKRKGVKFNLLKPK